MKRPGGFDRRAADTGSQPSTAPANSRPLAESANSRPRTRGSLMARAARVVRRAPLARSAQADALVPDDARIPADPVVPAESLVPVASHVSEVVRDKRRGSAGAQGSSVRLAKRQLRSAQRERQRQERREQRRFTGHVRARRRRLLVGVGAVLALALFVAAGVFTPVMAVRDIQVLGVQSADAEDLRLALSRFEGVPIALVQDREVHRALEPFPIIQRYAVERIPPHTLVVRIEERAPVIALAQEDGLAVYDPAGVLLGKVAEPPSGVPLGSPELFDTSSPAFAAAATVVRDFPEDLRAQLVSVRASNERDVTFVLAGGTEVVWGEAAQTQRKAVVLRAMLASIGAPEMIDVSVPTAPVFR